MIDFYQLGYALAEAIAQPASFKDFEFAAAKRKRCDRGYSCGLGCISSKKKCKKALNGEAKTFAEYVKKHKDKLTRAQRTAAKNQNIGIKSKDKIKKQSKGLVKKTASNQNLDLDKRVKLTRTLGDLENTVIPKAIAQQQKAEKTLKQAEKNLINLESDKQRFDKSVGSQASALINQSIAQAKSQIESAKKDLESANKMIKDAENQKAALSKELKSMPPPKVMPVSIDRLSKPLSKDEEDLIIAVSGSKQHIQNVNSSTSKLAEDFGGLASMRSTFKDYAGAPSLRIKQLITDAKSSDFNSVMNHVGRLVKWDSSRMSDIKEKHQREIEMGVAVERAKKAGLSDLESAAIVSYTTNGYVGINGYARGLSINPNSATAKYQDLMARATYQAVKKLPDFQGEVKRGSREPEDRIREFEDAMKNGKTVSFSGFTSTSATKSSDIEGGYGKSAKDQAMSGKGLEKAAEWQQLNNRADLIQWNPDGLKSVNYSIALKTGKKISTFSSQPKEEEVLVLPDSKFRVKSVKYDGDKAEIELEED